MMIRIHYFLTITRQKIQTLTVCLILLTCTHFIVNSEASPHPPLFTTGSLAIQLQSGKQIEYNVEIAETLLQRKHGLKLRTSLDTNAGMLFLFPKVELIHMWMQDTLIPLDMLFINSRGEIVSITENTSPFSEEIISSQFPVAAVLELNAGTVKNEGIIKGDMVLHSRFGNH